MYFDDESEKMQTRSRVGSPRDSPFGKKLKLFRHPSLAGASLQLFCDPPEGASLRRRTFGEGRGLFPLFLLLSYAGRGTRAPPEADASQKQPL